MIARRERPKAATFWPIASAYTIVCEADGHAPVEGRLIDMSGDSVTFSTPAAFADDVAERWSARILLGHVALAAFPLGATASDDDRRLHHLAFAYRPESNRTQALVRAPYHATVRLATDLIANYDVCGDVAGFDAATIDFIVEADTVVLPGQRLRDVALATSHTGSARLDLTIAGSVPHAGRRLVRARIDAAGRRATGTLAQFGALCLSSPGTTPAELSAALGAAGFSLSELRPVLAITIARTEPDFAAVAAVRHEADVRAGKIDERGADDELRDAYDGIAVVFLAKIGDTAVGTVRMVPQIDGYLPCREYYPHVAQSADATTCEISRLAVAPAFQRTDAAFLLMTHIIDLAIVCRQRIGYSLVTRSLERLYPRFGARCAARGALHPHVPDEPMALYSFDIVRLLRGRGVLPVVHLLAIAPAARRYARFGILAARCRRFPHALTGRIMLAIYRRKHRRKRHGGSQ